MQKIILTLVLITTIAISMNGCGETELPIGEDSRASSEPNFQAELEQAMELFNTVEPYIAVNADGTISLDLPDDGPALTHKQFAEVQDIIMAANSLVRSGELTINPEFPKTEMAPAGWTGMNGVYYKWWGFIIALDREGTRDLITDLASIQLGIWDVTLRNPVVWPFIVPIAVSKITLFACRQAIELAARRGTGIFMWVTWTGQPFFVCPQ